MKRKQLALARTNMLGSLTTVRGLGRICMWYSVPIRYWAPRIRRRLRYPKCCCGLHIAYESMGMLVLILVTLGRRVYMPRRFYIPSRLSNHGCMIAHVWYINRLTLSKLQNLCESSNRCGGNVFCAPHSWPSTMSGLSVRETGCMSHGGFLRRTFRLPSKDD